MKYIRLFEQHSEYAAAESGLTLPNVSHCVAENEVHYNAIGADNRIIAVFNFPSNGNFALYGSENVGEEDEWYEYEISGASVFDSIEIDGVEYPISEIESQLVVNPAYNSHIKYPMTAGEHTIKYTLKDPTTICDYMFSECLITSIVIPNTVTSIGDKAFKYCYHLTSVTLSDNTVSIGEEGFYYDSSLSSITLNDNITSIGDNCFEYCYGLTSINIPSSLVSIGYYAFCGTHLDSATTNLIESINPDGVCGEM